jgi:tetratricopeptide (TPR) repeat protein
MSSTSTPEQSLEHGLALLQDGDFESAIQALTGALEEEPSATGYYYRGVACDMAGSPQEAVADFTRSLELDPGNTQVLYSRSVAHRNLSQWEESFADTKLAYELEPEDFRVVNAYAQFLVDSPVETHRDLTKALEIATQACELTDWQDSICMETLAQALVATGDAEQAADLRERYRKMSPTNFDFDTVQDELMDYFEYLLDTEPEPLGLHEIVPCEPSITVCAVRSESNERPNVLFTTGMSRLPMSLPEDADLMQHGFAEVCILLPKDWKMLPDLDEPAQSWPWMWLRAIAHYPHQNETCLGLEPALYPREGELEPLAPGCPFYAFLIMPNLANFDGFVSDEGPYINILTAIPLYREEYDLAAKQGFEKLLELFEKHRIGLGVDLQRPNTALPI